MSYNNELFIDLRSIFFQTLKNAMVTLVTKTLHVKRNLIVTLVNVMLVILETEHIVQVFIERVDRMICEGATREFM